MRAFICLVPLMLAGCAGAYEPRPLTEKQTSELDKALAGKVAGERVSCINRFPQSSLKVISDNVLLYRVSSKLTYRNDLIGSCSGLTRGDTLVTRSHTSQLCRGDIANVVDLPAGMLTGSCALGDFVPYRTPK